MKKLWLVGVLAMVVSAGAQQATLLLWPNGNPEPTRVTEPEGDITAAEHHMVAGKPSYRVTNVSKPNMAVYLPPAGKNTGAAALVFPGGGYVRLSMELEGTEVCQWLNSLGMACVLVKYRVPETQHFPENTEDLEDAQQAMRLTREHAAEWKIDPKKVGVIGFSAGGHLAVALSTHPEFQGKTVPPDSGDARPDFQLLLYPAYLLGPDGKVAAALMPAANVPPTFIAMAENDTTARVETALGYYQALKDAKVAAEMHLYTQGGHGFGMRPAEAPVPTVWPKLAEAWLRTIHVLGAAGKP